MGQEKWKGGRWGRYALAAAGLGTAVLIRWTLDPWLGPHVPLATLYGAVALAIWIADLRFAVFLAVAGYLASDWLFIDPRGELSLTGVRYIAGIITYSISCGIIIAGGEALRRAQRRAQASERAHAISEARYRTLVDSLPFSVWQTDALGGSQYSNAFLQAYAGMEAKQLEEADWAAIIHPDDAAAVQQAWREGIAGARPFELDHRLRRAADGQYRWFRTMAAPVAGADGRVEQWVGASVDIHDRREAEQSLRKSEAELSDFFDTAAIGLHWVDENGIVLRVNEAELQMLGYRHDEYVGRHIAEFHADRGAVDDILTRLCRGERINDYPARMKCKDGSVRDVLIRSSVLFHDGRFIHTRCFTQDVTERLRAERALQEADRRKNEFLATLAHELRNPLAPISNAVQFLKLTGPQDPGLAWGRDVIDRQVTQMAHLLDDLLDVNRISRGKIELRRERVRLAAVVESAIETMRTLIDGAQHRLTVELPPDDLYFDADPLRLAQVLGNLLSNAAKYTPDGGSIRLSAVRQGDEACVTVEDSGIGIDAAMLPHVFDMFAQAEPARERSRGGLGVGLALVRALTEMHGGRVEAYSDGRGAGARFRIWLPVANPPPKAVDRRADLASLPAASPRRVLVVDDLKDSADSLARLLASFGHEVRTAHDGPQAIEVAERYRPDVVLLDLGMPKMDGYDTCRHIRSQPWGRDMRLVALTGWGQESDRQRTRSAGFAAHLTKPVDPAMLVSTLAPDVSETPRPSA